MSFGSTPLTDSPRDMESESFDITTITHTLNQDGRDAVAMEGITKLGLGIVEAHESGSPTWSSTHVAKLAITLSETSGTSNDPLLTVTHSAAGSSVPIFKHHYSQQRAR
jgi:hypothetical protein